MDGGFKKEKLLRLKDVLARIPISKSAWWAGVRKGIYPRGHRVGPRVLIWTETEIELVVQQILQDAFEKIKDL